MSAKPFDWMSERDGILGRPQPETPMRMEAFTPGPWRVDRDDTGPSVYTADWETRIADVRGDNLANAALISAAPEMFEALSGLLDMLDGGAPLNTAPARAALAKASGQ